MNFYLFCLPMDSLPQDTPRQALTIQDSGWSRLIQGIVRPPRFLYDEESLGSSPATQAAAPSR